MARTDNLWINRVGNYIETSNPDGYHLLINGDNRYINFRLVSGSLGYGFRDNNGTIQFKHSGGAWADVGSGGSGSMTYPGAGIALSTGTAWGTSITNNSSNWNTAYGWGNHASAGYLTASNIVETITDGVTTSAPSQNAVFDALVLKAPLISPTFATSITGSYLTASQILGTDASKNIVSLPVATYPSLVELAYVKGVTSALQTQLNNKQPLATVLTNTTASYTTTINTRLANTSGTNTGDNATNSQYSGLATSKQDTLVSGTNIKTINSTSILGSGNISISGTVDLASFTSLISGADSSTSPTSTDLLPVIVTGDPTLIDSYDETNNSASLAVTAGNLAGQSFYNTNSIVLNSCKLYLKQSSAGAGTCYVKIYAHTGTYGAGGKPTGSPLATSDSFNLATIGTTDTLVTFNFTGANKITLSAATNYCVTVQNDAGSSVNIVFDCDNTSPTHGGNVCFSNDGGTNWSVLNTFDGIFYIYGDSASTTKKITYTNFKNPRVGSTTSSATPTINTDSYDAYTITALSTAITSFTTNLSGTPSDFQRLLIRIKDDGTARAITWGTSFQSGTSSLPTTTIAGKVLMVGLIYNSTDSKWTCEASGSRA